MVGDATTPYGHTGPISGILFIERSGSSVYHVIEWTSSKQESHFFFRCCRNTWRRWIYRSLSVVSWMHSSSASRFNACTASPQRRFVRPLFFYHNSARRQRLSLSTYRNPPKRFFRLRRDFCNAMGSRKTESFWCANQDKPQLVFFIE